MITTAAVLAVVIWGGRPGTGTEGAGTVAGNPLEYLDLVLAEGDAPDFVEDGEDLEFYEWAAGELES